MFQAGAWYTESVYDRRDNIMNNNYLAGSFMRVVIFIFIAFSLLATSSCNNQKPVKIKTVGIVLFGDSRQPQVDGFKDGLARLGYKSDETIKFIILNAKNKRPKLKALVQELIDKDVSLLVAIGVIQAGVLPELIT
jgi:ABC-type uncharacterized transport system substrate-binding protein